MGMPPSPDPVVRAACDQVSNHPVCVHQAERARGPTEMRGTSGNPPVCPRVRACRCQYPACENLPVLGPGSAVACAVTHGRHKGAVADPQPVAATGGGP